MFLGTEGVLRGQGTSPQPRVSPAVPMLSPCPQSARSGRVLPPAPFLVQDSQQEQHFGFSLSQALSRARRRPLLQVTVPKCPQGATRGPVVSPVSPGAIVGAQGWTEGRIPTPRPLHVLSISLLCPLCVLPCPPCVPSVSPACPQGYEVHVTPSVRPEPEHMKDIITCSGGTFLPAMPCAYGVRDRWGCGDAGGDQGDIEGTLGYQSHRGGEQRGIEGIWESQSHQRGDRRDVGVPEPPEREHWDSRANGKGTKGTLGSQSHQGGDRRGIEGIFGS